MACVPAYDEYFITGIKSQEIKPRTYSINSVLKLADFYERNFERLEEKRKQLRVNDLMYPQMKLLDMGVWQIGKDKLKLQRNK